MTKWTPDKDKTLKTMAANGFTQEEVATVFDTTAMAIHMRAHKIGIKGFSRPKHSSMYTRKWVLEQLRRVHSGEATRTQIAKEHGVSLSMVSLLLSGKRGPLSRGAK